MNLKSLFLSALLGAFCVGLASAQVAAVNTASANYAIQATNTFSYTLTNTSLTNKVLVFATYIDAGSSASTVSNATFNGVAATATFSNDRLFVAYFVTPSATSGNFVFNSTLSGSGSGYIIYELDNVDTSVAFNASTGTALTTTSDNRFFLSILGVNNGLPVSPSTSGVVVTTTNVFDSNSGSGGGSIVSGYASSTGAAAAKTVTWSTSAGGQSGQFNLALTSATSAVPEPGTYALIASVLCFLLVAFRRLGA